VALGGEATVFAADAIREGGADDIVAMFRRTREQEYRALKNGNRPAVTAWQDEKAGLIKGEHGRSFPSGIARQIQCHRTHRLLRCAGTKKKGRR
jgi:hypothetical protein